MPQLYAHLASALRPERRRITRREMLQTSLAAAAGVLLSDRLGGSPAQAGSASSSLAPASAA